ncbi:hypothetical protein [Flavobacterium sp.]|uniref:hypothetical protein n=1 Tax=Flavobacterium sp. TaxID=239 RepID=UPI0031CEB3CA
MRIKLSIIFLILLQFSCKEKTEKQFESQNNQVEKTKTDKVEIQPKSAVKFGFEKFLISKGKIGEIKIGMTIQDAEKLLTQLTKTKVEAYDFGFDGGGEAYLYSLGTEPVIALIPKMGSEEILAIAAVSKDLKTNNGLCPKSTVAEIQAKYPNIKVVQNLMMEWEYMEDEKNNQEFIFMTNENNKIGEYGELEVPVNPKRTNIKADWITIK